MADDGGGPGGDTDLPAAGTGETWEGPPPVPPARYSVPGYGPGGYGPSGYGPGGYGPSGYGPSGYGPSGYGPSGYGPGGYGPPAGQWAYPPVGYGAVGHLMARRRTNGLAVASLVLACTSILLILTAPLAVVFGHVALVQTKRRDEDGWGLALAGTILGWFLTVGWTALLVVGFTHRGASH